MIAIAEFFEEIGENIDLFGVFSMANGDAFFGVITPIADFATLDALQKFVLGRGKIERPGMSWIEVVRLFKPEFLEKIRG